MYTTGFPKNYSANTKMFLKYLQLHLRLINIVCHNTENTSISFMLKKIWVLLDLLRVFTQTPRPFICTVPTTTIEISILFSFSQSIENSTILSIAKCNGHCWVF